MGKESHYSSKKDRVFVRGIQGQYSLNDELTRLRSQPRVVKGRTSCSTMARSHSASTSSSPWTA